MPTKTSATSQKPTLALIAAVAENGIIGRDGDLPWHLPADLQFFKRTTRGHTVIMGRRTYESLGGALPHRRNIIVTRRDPSQFTGARLEPAPSLERAIAMATEQPNPDTEIFIAGGEQLYRQALPIAHRLYITRVHANPQGDTRFPDFDPAQWTETAREHHPADENHAHAFTFLTYQRR